MNLISYNVNGIRAAITKDFLTFLATENPDIICLQEVKATPDQLDLSPITALGYHIEWHAAEKKGYSGTATFSKNKPDLVSKTTNMAEYDAEGRVLRTDFGDLTIFNCYFPSGTSGDERQDFKMNFLRDFQIYIQALLKERPNIIVVGDYNIAHTEIDIHDPKGNKNSTGFLPEEREWVTGWLQGGFIDAYRHANPEKVEYSWWSYRSGARANNKGWRIDYQCASLPLAEKIVSSRHIGEAMQSDHCPIKVVYNL